MQLWKDIKAAIEPAFGNRVHNMNADALIAELKIEDQLPLGAKFADKLELLANELDVNILQ